MNIGKAIKDIRTQYTEFNQKEFAEKIGISQTYLSQLENNKKNASTDLLKKIGTVANIPMQIFLYKSITENDIPKHKRKAYKILKPTVDALINEFI